MSIPINDGEVARWAAHLSDRQLEHAGESVAALVARIERVIRRERELREQIAGRFIHVMD